MSARRRRIRRRRKRGRRYYRFAVIGFSLVLVLSVAGALTNTIGGVTPPRLGNYTAAITPYALEPQACKSAGLNPTSIVEGTTGTTGDDLILGTSAGETIRGDSAVFGPYGNDCILGGGGNDTIHGDSFFFIWDIGNGTDVCIGGPGSDSFGGCETTIQDN
jgi:Ca2+-binding RTX toxin-like protein